MPRTPYLVCSVFIKFDFSSIQQTHVKNDQVKTRSFRDSQRTDDAAGDGDLVASAGSRASLSEVKIVLGVCRSRSGLTNRRQLVGGFSKKRGKEGPDDV